MLLYDEIASDIQENVQNMMNVLNDAKNAPCNVTLLSKMVRCVSQNDCFCFVFVLSLIRQSYIYKTCSWYSSLLFFFF